jgi:hypothetical protein
LFGAADADDREFFPHSGLTNNQLTSVSDRLFEGLTSLEEL